MGYKGMNGGNVVEVNTGEWVHWVAMDATITLGIKGYQWIITGM